MIRAMRTRTGESAGRGIGSAAGIGALVAALLLPARMALPQIVVDTANPSWFVYEDGSAHFLAGPGDPEDFLYRGTLNDDGTRTGDQDEIIRILELTGGNGIYFQAVRSHGGDGDETHNPFMDHDPEQGLNDAVLDQWEAWFSRLDEAGIVMYFFIFDDSTNVWGPHPQQDGSVYERILRFLSELTGWAAEDVSPDEMPAAEERFVTALVDRFEHHGNIVWVVAEEYDETFTAERVSRIAGAIRSADDFDHPIAVHKLMGLAFEEFADDDAVDQFAIQYTASSAAELHAAMVRAWEDAAGCYNLNLAELPMAQAGTGEELRRKLWAIAMGGAYVMVLGMDVVNSSEADLRSLQDIVDFMESTDVNTMSPRDELGVHDADYVLASEAASYIVYAADPQEGIVGLRGLPAGSYRLRWFDIARGTALEEASALSEGGEVTVFDIPPGMGAELALHARRTNVPSDGVPGD